MLPRFERLRAALGERYAIEREIGAGGMATVYLAEDRKHHRRVAVKVLRPELAVSLGADRFLREIEIAARLTHPHILSLYDSGETEDFLYYVMPFVEGETLRHRLLRERQLPVDDALDIAVQVAHALSYAHEHGVVHRDIKPENILLADGEAMVADFGIAKAISDAGGERLTQTGIAVGTPAYMSPEQATGEENLDGRSDVYGLGCVLYEMLAGELPFGGPNLQTIMSRKLAGTPQPLHVLRERVPAAVDLILEKALARVPADRYVTAQRLAEDLERAMTPAGQPVITPLETLAQPAGRPGLARVLAVALAVVSILLAISLWRPWAGEVEVAAPTAFAVGVPETEILDQSGFGSPVAISRDGRTLAYVAGNGATTRLYLRPLETTTATVIPGTEGATAPFFSPDGKWIAFFADELLKKVPLVGGSPQVICNAPGPRSGYWWNDDGIVVGSAGNLQRFLPAARSDWTVLVERSGLDEVSASRGWLGSLTVADSGGGALFTHHWPRTLPGGDAVVFTIFNAPGWKPGNLQVAVLDRRTGEIHVVVNAGTDARYMSSGHLVYGWNGELRIVPFDLQSLTVTGPSVPVALGVRMTLIGSVFYDVSDDGTLVYVPGRAEESGRSLVWASPDAPEEPLDLAAGYFQSPRIAPAGDQLVFGDYQHIWSYQLQRGTLDRITNDQATEYWAQWAPNGQVLFFNSGRSGGAVVNLHQFTPGDGTVERIGTSEFHQVPQSVSPDGRIVLFTQVVDSATGMNIFALSRGSGSVEPWLATRYDETVPTFSPDGIWVAYASNASGSYEIYARRYDGGPPFRMSTDGGWEPLWAPDGRTLYYRDPSGDHVLAVPFNPDSPGSGDVHTLLGGQYVKGDIWGRNYDITPDGRRFLMIRDEPAAPARQFHVIVNWAVTAATLLDESG